MLGVNQLDFLNYTTAFKGNYRKGPHKLRAILSTPTQAKEFCTNLGGVSVIFGVPLDRPDKNSEELLEILQGSPYNDMAVETWLHGFYDFDSLDTLLYDAAMCQALANDAAIFRAVGTSEVAVGKLLCGLAGLDPANYENIDAVAASDIAMVKVAASKSAMAAAVRSPIATTTLVGSKIAMTALVASSVAMDTIAGSQAYMTVLAGNSAAMTIVAGSETAMASVAKSKTAMTAVAASQTAMAAVAASQTAMTAVAKSYVAVAAIWKNTTAVQKVQANSTAWTTFTGASSAVMGKAVASLAGLNPSNFADMTAVAASQTAMTAIGKSATARSAVAASTTAMNAICASSMATAKYATGAAGLDPSGYADMTAVAASSTAMAAVATSATARNAITSSNVAKTALASSPLKKTVTSSNGSYGTVVSGRCFIISVKNNNSGNTGARNHYFRYVFSGSSTSTTTVNFSASYSEAAQVNMFTDSSGISYYNNDAIPGLITYIPC